MVQMSQIDRLTSKLETIYFLNQFDESIDRLLPAIDSFTKASLSLIDKKRFLKFLKVGLLRSSMVSIFFYIFLQIILYLGNFINYGKKQYAYGYKIKSLNKVKKSNRIFKKLNYL